MQDIYKTLNFLFFLGSFEKNRELGPVARMLPAEEMQRETLLGPERLPQTYLGDSSR